MDLELDVADSVLGTDTDKEPAEEVKAKTKTETEVEEAVDPLTSVSEAGPVGVP